VLGVTVKKPATGRTKAKTIEVKPAPAPSEKLAPAKAA